MASQEVTSQTVYRLKALVNVPKGGIRFAEKGDDFETSDEAWAEHLVAARYAEKIAETSAAETSASDRPVLDVTDAAAELAETHGIELSEAVASGGVVGSGEDGRILKSDVEALIDE